MRDKSCDTCAHKVAESRGPDSARIVDCEINEFQMYAPFAEECKHWEKSDERAEA